MALPILADVAVPPVFAHAGRVLFGDGELLRHVADAAGGLAVTLALAALTLAGTIWASRWLSQLAARGIARAHRRRPPDTTLQTFAA
ncbi:MAG TPA: hypothetical protein VGN89_10990, partial [Phenylobacterium sp.]|nr:hypothetical protein [Phenylobacterium sp.]